MMRGFAAVAMLVLCYLGACFVTWEFPNPYAGMEPPIRTLWLIAAVLLVGYTHLLVKQRKS